MAIPLLVVKSTLSIPGTDAPKIATKDVGIQQLEVFEMQYHAQIIQKFNERVPTHSA